MTVNDICNILSVEVGGDDETGISSPTKNNIVTEDSVKKIQLRTLKEISECLSKTFGPMGSNTMFISGDNPKTLKVEYTKDGHKVLGRIISKDPIAMATQKELVEVTRHTEHVVGDGTTSATILSYYIYAGLLYIIEQHISTPPYEIIRTFKEVVCEIQKKILEKKRDITLEDIYNICMISTNGDDELSSLIKTVYEQFGFDVDIEVGISNTEDTLVKEYDGCTITTGYADSAFVNRVDKGVCEIRDARVYHFKDPIDTPEMVNLFDAIVYHNIMEPSSNEEPYIPTVILTPKFSRDLSALFQKLVGFMYQYHEQGADAVKPPLLIITNICGADEYIADDIANLCGCKSIRQYIDPKIQDMDIKQGLAPSIDNVHEFYGTADMVVSDKEKTKFINPKNMYIEDEDGSRQPSGTYHMIMDLLKSELSRAIENNETAGTISVYKKRLRSLNGNMLDLLIGGISISDRDMKKDLAVDAVKNCASASIRGVGYAANFEGLRASMEVANECKEGLKGTIANTICEAYIQVSAALYSTMFKDVDIISASIAESISRGMPMNFYTGKYDGSVLSSIMTDVEILNAISQLITIMVTSNQCLLQAPGLNIY